ncbi:unnamed protein product [Cylicostephanus goldi]|uniref:Uncharacterized protein n=1 Tax=Cylicostephanus goldi TaxID=71465 RepID=A0A3P7NGT5_CYLGO|nr:unnamed protein product [Cylicostephanus goldi]
MLCICLSEYEARRRAYYEEYTRSLEQRKQEAQRRRAEEERRRAELARQGERQEYDERDLPQLLKPENNSDGICKQLLADSLDSQILISVSGRFRLSLLTSDAYKTYCFV